MSLEVYFRALSWALPTLAVGSLLLLLVSGPLSRRLGLPPPAVIALGVSVIGFVAVTATPGSSASWTAGSRWSMGGGARWVSPAELLDPWSEAGMNVWLAVPMALVAGYVAVRHGRAWPVALVVVLPVVVEVVQMLLPELGRSALLADVAANEQGVVLGLLLGVVAGLALRRRTPATR